MSVEFFTLKENPARRESYIKVIEESFEYTSESSTRLCDDFYPLFAEENASHCYGLWDPAAQEVVATTAAFKRSISKKLVATILGGIVVNPKRRGQGHLRYLLEKIFLRQDASTDAYMLWSEKEELFAKFGFVPAFEQMIIPKQEGGAVLPLGWEVAECRLNQISPSLWPQIQQAFMQRYGSVPHMDRAQYWDCIKGMTSVIGGILTCNGEFAGYYFRNKGKDLPGIVHEWSLQQDFSSKEHIEVFLSHLTNQFSIWDYPDSNLNLPYHRSILGLVKVVRPSWTEQLQSLFVGGVDSL